MNNYRVNNYGGSYYDQGRLGYSSVSKNYGISNRSTYISTKICWDKMITISVSYNTCFRMSERNLRKLNRNLNMIWIMKENSASNFKISWSNWKTSLVAKKSLSPNSNLKSITCYIRTKILLSRISDSKMSYQDSKISMVVKSMS
jgi:hypothetical protein